MESFWKARVLLTLFIVFLFSLTQQSSGNPATGNFGTNEIYGTEEDEIETESLPVCQRDAICGMVEVSAFGVSVVPLCNCKSNRPNCALTWDALDGHSVTIGSKQYKFCDRTFHPRICSRNQKAYVSSYSFHPSNFQMTNGAHLLHCYCPTNRFLSPALSEEEYAGGMLIVKSIHTCNLLPRCESSQVCKEVTMSEYGANVAVKCQCTLPFVCPTITQENIPHSNQYARGSAYSVYCQETY